MSNYKYFTTLQDLEFSLRPQASENPCVEIPQLVRLGGFHKEGFLVIFTEVKKILKIIKKEKALVLVNQTSANSFLLYQLEKG